MRFNRILLVLSCFGGCALIFQYALDLSVFALWNNVTGSVGHKHHQVFSAVNSFAKLGKISELRCENKADLTAKGVDIRTDDLWWQLFRRNSTRQPLDEQFWTTLKYDKNAVVKEKPLKIFVVPHSHVDPGWLKTFDQYTEDTNRILDNMLSYLPDHPKMTFMWMEISFFYVWFQRLNADQRATLKTLIRRQQFHISSGSWVMTDEATPYFWASIDNIIEGHQFLYRELNMTPTVIWTNDPFGYGPTAPYLFKLADVSRMVIHRIHTYLKIEFSATKTMDYHYRQFFDPTGHRDLLVHVLPFEHYDVLRTCGPDSRICCQFDFKRMTHFTCPGPMPTAITSANIAERANMLYDQYRQASQMYRNNVLLIMLGDDFRFDLMEEWSQQYDNYALLMDYMNNRSDWNVQIQFGTLQQFFTALEQRNEEAPQKDQEKKPLKGNRQIFSESRFPVLSGDFFPYSDSFEIYWTGFYTTRPFFKRQDRLVQAMIRSADIAFSLAYLSGKQKREVNLRTQFRRLTDSRRNLAIFQHHDAITGTSKPHVVTDYGEKLYSALQNASSVAAAAVSALIGSDKNILNWTQTQTSYFAIAEHLTIKTDSGKTKNLWLYNSLPHFVVDVAKVVVEHAPCWIVHDNDGRAVTSQLTPIIRYEHNKNPKRYFLSFEAKLSPLGTTRFTITKTSRADKLCAVPARIFMKNSASQEFSFPSIFISQPLEASHKLIELSNDYITTYHNGSSGYLLAIKRNNLNNEKANLAWNGNLSFWHYSNTQSGAYIFYHGSDARPWTAEITALIVVKGLLTEEIHSFREDIYHMEYLKKLPPGFESNIEVHMENVLDIRIERNVEVVMRLHDKSLRDDQEQFLTDSMGFQLMPRRFLPNRPIESNYYPMASQLVLQNDKKRVTLLSGQPHGATRCSAGTMEIMLDRILAVDDGKGLGYDAIARDNVPAHSVFKLVVEFGNFKHSRFLSLQTQRSLQTLLYPPLIFQQTVGGELHPSEPMLEEFSCDTQLLNLRPVSYQGAKMSFLILIHRLGFDCGADLEATCLAKDKRDALSQFSNYVGNPEATTCNLAGLKVEPKPTTKSLSAILSDTSLNPMDIQSVCF